MNNFQQAMLGNKEVAWEIVKASHPDIQDEYLNKYRDAKIISRDRLKIYTNYDWVCIELNIQTHIRVSIGIKFECKLMSGDKPLHLFEKELKNNKFMAWRFIEDSKFKEDRDSCSDIVNNILKKHNIPKPTAKQMSDFYHSN